MSAVVRIPQPPPEVPQCRDALDLPFIHLAVASKAQVRVSDAADFLPMADKLVQVGEYLILSRKPLPGNTLTYERYPRFSLAGRSRLQ